VSPTPTPSPGFLPVPEGGIEMEVDNARAQPLPMPMDLDPIGSFQKRLESNLTALTSAVLSDPTLRNMIVHGQGLQQLTDSLAAAGQKWHHNVVMANEGIEPRVGAMEVASFYQRRALQYPEPYRIIQNPNMDLLEHDLLAQ
jgi:hypothetical protein